jgi:hypothetical protein
MFGNQYGNATTFPVRRAMPTSDQVMSDPEFMADWQSRLDAIPQTISAPGEGGGVQSLTYDWGSNQNKSFGAPGGAGVQSVTAGQDYGLGSPGGAGTQSVTLGSDIGFIPRAVGATGIMGITREQPTSLTQVNPEWQRLKNEMDAAMQQRQEAQTANQQAYDVMLGQGQKNGVMGAGYSNPGFGRVDGMAQNPYAVNAQDNNNPAFAGYQQDTTALTGVYDPIAQTKELFWGL